MIKQTILLILRSLNMTLNNYNCNMSKKELSQIASSRRYSQVPQLLMPFQFVQLISKIDLIANSAEVDLVKNSLQMMGIEKNSNRSMEDPLTKLKNIQNKSQINRAQVELMLQRRPKRFSLKSRRQNEQNGKDYKKIYQQFKFQKMIKEVVDTELNSQDQQTEGNQIPPNGIKHYNFLRQHPKILEFTLEKMKNKNSEERIKSQRQIEKNTIKKASRPAALLFDDEYRQVIESSRRQKKDDLASPKNIVDNQLTKFYSKSSKGKIDIKIRDNPRCNTFLQKQEHIASMAESRNMSKQNMKKLKQKLNEIVNEINKSDKKSNKKQVLPKLMGMAASSSSNGSGFF